MKYIYLEKAFSAFFFPTLGIWPKPVPYAKGAARLLVIFDEMV